MTEEIETVWVISRGSYSDYRVLAQVRGSKKDAELLAARANAAGDDLYGDPYEVESLPVVSPDVQKVETLMLIAEIRDQGPSVKDEKVSIRVEWPFDSLYALAKVEWRWVRAPVHQGRGGRLEVWGTDHERVRKVYGDRKAMLLSDDAMRAKRESRGGR
jgi:hypothetical protein